MGDKACCVIRGLIQIKWELKGKIHTLDEENQKLKFDIKKWQNIEKRL